MNENQQACGERSRTISQIAANCGQILIRVHPRSPASYLHRRRHQLSLTTMNENQQACGERSRTISQIDKIFICVYQR